MNESSSLTTTAFDIASYFYINYSSTCVLAYNCFFYFCLFLILLLMWFFSFQCPLYIQIIALIRYAFVSYFLSGVGFQFIFKYWLGWQRRIHNQARKSKHLGNIRLPTHEYKIFPYFFTFLFLSSVFWTSFCSVYGIHMNFVIIIHECFTIWY